MVSTVQQLRSALEGLLSEGAGKGEGKVAIGVYRAGREPVSAFVERVTWGALWDALALDPQDEQGEDDSGG